VEPQYKSGKRQSNPHSTSPLTGPVWSRFSHQNSKTPKLGSGKPESSLPLSLVLGFWSTQRILVCPSQVALMNWQRGMKFIRLVITSDVWMSPTEEASNLARCVASRILSLRRWCEEFVSDPQGQESSAWFGCGSEGERFQKTCHIVRVSFHLTSQRWSGNLKDGAERGSSAFYWRRSCDRA